MGIWASSFNGDSVDASRIFIPFEPDKKYNILAPVSKESNGYLKCNHSGGSKILMANGLGGTDDPHCKWIAKRNPIGTDIYWKFWTFDSKDEIVVTANNKVEIQPVSTGPDDRNLFLPTTLIKNEAYYQYKVLQPKSKETENKFLAANRDGTMTLVTNIDRSPVLNPNPQSTFMAFKVED